MSCDSNLDEALELLNSLIHEGREFPDAAPMAAQKAGVVLSELEAAYDRQFL